MKETLQSLRLHQRIKARVVETQIGGMLVVQFNDDLIRVLNTSGKNFKVGEQLDLLVTGIKPVEFKLYQRSQNFDRTI